MTGRAERSIEIVRALDTQRAIPLSRRSHITGSVPILGMSVKFESSLERDFLHLVAFETGVVSVVSQPMTIAFLDDGIERRYTPDFLVRRADRRPELVEIKYEADLRENKSRHDGSFAAARIWCGKQNWDFTVRTECFIRGARLANLKRLFRYRDSRIEEGKRTRILKMLDMPRSIGSMGLSPDLVASLWAMIANGEVNVSLDEPITPATVAKRP